MAPFLGKGKSIDFMNVLKLIMKKLNDLIEKIKLIFP